MTGPCFAERFAEHGPSRSCLAISFRSPFRDGHAVPISNATAFEPGEHQRGKFLQEEEASKTCSREQPTWASGGSLQNWKHSIRRETYRPRRRLYSRSCYVAIGWMYRH